MVFFLTLAILLAFAIAVPTRDHGMAVVCTTAAALCSMIIHFQVDSSVESTYIIHPEFFHKLTLLSMWGAFFYLFILGFRITFHESERKEYIRHLEAVVGAYEDISTGAEKMIDRIDPE